jgi:transposase
MTKNHAAVDALDNPVALSLTAGQVHDVTQAEPLLEDLAPDAVIADKGYGSDAFVKRLEARHHAGHSTEGQSKGDPRLRLRTLLRAQPR